MLFTKLMGSAIRASAEFKGETTTLVVVPGGTAYITDVVVDEEGVATLPPTRVSWKNVAVHFPDGFSALCLSPSGDEWGEGWWDFTHHPWNIGRNPCGKPKGKSQPGYHIDKIEKHPFQTLGKIKEELEEVIDAKTQGVRIMELTELSDLVGAIEGYLEKEYPTFTLKDLQDMAKVTRRAFESGRRK